MGARFAATTLTQLFLNSEVSTDALLGLDGLEKCLEVASAETLMVSTLDDLKEEGGSVLKWLGEDLEQVALVIVVHEDFLPLQDVDILLYLNVNVLKACADVVIVGVGDLVQEEDTTVFHAGHCLDNVLRAHGDVLHTWASVVVTELLDLALTLAVCRLVDRHLDFLIEVGHDDRSERTEVRVDHFVIDGPEAVEIEHLLVPLCNRLHLTIGLVTDTVIDVQEFRDWNQAVEDLSLRMIVVAGHENSGVVEALHERVNCVAISPH